MFVIMYKKYGKLEKIGSREGAYRLKCECGNIVLRSPQSLSRSLALGYTPSCGCSRKATNPEYIGIKSISRKSGVIFSLTEKQYNLVKLRSCYYCGVTSTRIACLYVDRGYVFENTIAMCSHCYSARGIMNHEEYLEWIKRILSFSKIRNFGLDKVIPI